MQSPFLDAASSSPPGSGRAAYRPWLSVRRSLQTAPHSIFFPMSDRAATDGLHCFSAKGNRACQHDALSSQKPVTECRLHAGKPGAALIKGEDDDLRARNSYPCIAEPCPRPTFRCLARIDGELLQISHAEAAERLRAGPCLVVHAPRNIPAAPARWNAAVDILELFVRPARFSADTAWSRRGLMRRRRGIMRTALCCHPPLPLLEELPTMIGSQCETDCRAATQLLVAGDECCKRWVPGLPPQGPTGPAKAEWIAGMAQVGGMVRTCAGAARREQACRGRGSAGKAGGPAWRWGGSAAKPGGLCRRCFSCFHAARGGTTPECCTGRSRHWRRQDPWVYCSSKCLGGKE